MKSLNQLLLDFDYEQNFRDDDFYVGKSNFYPFELINNWPNWEKNFLNISGEKFSGKTHLTNIFLKKFNGIKFESSLLNNENLKTIKPHQNVVLENLNLDVSEELIYTLFNIIDQDNKFLIITSSTPIAEIDFMLEDLKSRTKNCLLAKIENPDDELMFALILKNLSDRFLSIRANINSSSGFSIFAKRQFFVLDFRSSSLKLTSAKGSKDVIIKNLLS